MNEGLMRVELEESYYADELHVSDAFPAGIVEVRVGETDAINVRVAGPAKLVERIRREVIVSDPEPGTHVGIRRLHIRGLPTNGVFVARRAGSGRHPIRSMWHVPTTIKASGGAALLEGDSLGVVRVMAALAGYRGVLAACEVVVTVPRLTGVTIADGAPTAYVVGDTDGPLVLSLHGPGDAIIGRVGSTRVELGGIGGAEIEEVNGGGLHATLSAGGGLKVRRGDVEHVDLTVSSRRGAAYAGVARHAQLSVHGGRIWVNQVTESLRKLETGGGRAYVRVPPRLHRSDDGRTS